MHPQIMAASYASYIGDLGCRRQLFYPAHPRHCAHPVLTPPPVNPVTMCTTSSSSTIDPVTTPPVLVVVVFAAAALMLSVSGQCLAGHPTMLLRLTAWIGRNSRNLPYSWQDCGNHQSLF